MTYNRPEDFLYDIEKGKIPLRAVSMEQFLLAHAWIGVDQPNSPRIKRNCVLNGSVYMFSFQIQSIKYPEEGQNLAGGLQ